MGPEVEITTFANPRLSNHLLQVYSCRTGGQAYLGHSRLECERLDAAHVATDYRHSNHDHVGPRPISADVKHYLHVVLVVRHDRRMITFTVTNQTGCSVSGDKLQYRLKEGVYHRHTRQVTQLFIYLLTQRRTAAKPTFVLLLRHDSARHPW